MRRQLRLKPGKPCKVCRHSGNAAISAAFRAGHSPRQAARLYDLSRPALERHRRVCLVRDPGLGYSQGYAEPRLDGGDDAA